MQASIGRAAAEVNRLQLPVTVYVQRPQMRIIKHQPSPAVGIADRANQCCPTAAVQSQSVYTASRY
ncbi:hypothetical protein GCM10022228_23520 [Halomonas cibimaris]|uniref:Uncharacterized protein n=1 Tax=Halomonas cibimaris TaxID=657012 RepID=A0ABP7M0G6_9GAMM